MGIILVVLGLILLIINIVVIACVIDSGNGLEISRDISVAELLLCIFILPLAVIVVNSLRTNPWRCFKDWIGDILDYRPFEKKK